MGWDAVAVAAALLTVALAGAIPAGAEEAPPMMYGIDLGGVDGLAADGAKPQLASFWVGVWNRNNWGGVDWQIQQARNKGVTPIIQWYYWGDDISSSCVEDGCYSGLHANKKTKEEWFAMAKKLAASLDGQAGGREALVIIETEFNKGDIVSPGYAPTFDAYLKQQIDIFHAVGVKTILGFGSWFPEGWKRFPQATAATDYIGFQIMRGSTRHTEAQYLDAAQSAVDTARTLKSYFGKPLIFTDLSLSSYPEPYWAGLQDKALKDVFARMPELQSLGVQGLVFRSRADVNMNLDNYFGQAERHWGLVRQDGSWKPAYKTWLDNTRSAVSIPAKPVPGSVEAEAFALKSTGGAFNDAAASGGKHWNLWTNGHVADFVRASESGEHVFEVVAKGSSAAGVWPTMVLLVDGAKRGEWSVSSATYRSYKATVPLTAGQSTSVQISFTNDVYVNGEDRNLVVDVLRVDKAAPPATAVPGSVEAEAFALKSAGGAFADPTASGGKHWNLWTNGHVAHRVQSSATGDHVFEIVAKATPAAGVWPRMSLTVGGAPRGEWDVVSGDYLTYRARVPLVAGQPAEVRISFTNDAYLGGEDRNLLLDVLRVRAPNVPPEPGFTALSEGLAVTVDASQSRDPDGDALTYRWDWGDGTTGTGAKATKTYGKSGTYTVTLTASDGIDSASVSRTVTVRSLTYFPASLEAEDFAVKTTGAAVSDGSASGGRAWLLWSNGSLRHDLAVPQAGEFSLTVTARGNHVAGAWSRMEVRLGGETVGAADVTSTAWKEYSFRLALAADDSRSLEVLFVNDHWGGASADRNLWVDKVALARAAPRVPVEAEAEGCVKSTGGRVTAQSASGGAYWNVWSNGHVECTLTAEGAGAYRVEVVASGTPAQNKLPHAVLTVDGAKVAEWDVSTGSWRTYSATVNLQAGAHKVRVAFTNDAMTGREDRNLHVDLVRLVPT